MDRKIVWTDSAWNDLQEIAEYIAKDSANYAAAFVREVREAARSLATLSERGRVVPETNTESIRELFVRSYRLIYQVGQSEIHVIGFIHGARQLLEAWKK